MSKYRQPFLKILSKNWAEQFPQWKRAAYVCSTRREKYLDSTFSSDQFLESHGLLFHFFIEFTPKWPGAFTGELVVATSKQPFDGFPPIRWHQDIPSFVPGMYRIGIFTEAGHDRWWRLVDDTQAWNEQVMRMRAPVDKQALLMQRDPYHWYADSYDKPLPDIMTAAAMDFTDVFRMRVLPAAEAFLHRKA